MLASQGHPMTRWIIGPIHSSIPPLRHSAPLFVVHYHIQASQRASNQGGDKQASGDASKLIVGRQGSKHATRRGESPAKILRASPCVPVGSYNAKSSARYTQYVHGMWRPRRRVIFISMSGSDAPGYKG